MKTSKLSSVHYEARIITSVDRGIWGEYRIATGEWGYPITASTYQECLDEAKEYLECSPDIANLVIAKVTTEYTDPCFKTPELREA